MQNGEPKYRRNSHDVSNTVNVTDPASVADALETIFLNLFPDANSGTLKNAVTRVAQMYRGEHPTFAPCDTGYHDLQHIMDVTLASARLMDGYERTQKSGAGLGEEMFVFGILLALFHDSGYLRKRGVEDDRKGAEFTLVHVSRSAERLRSYMQEVGLGKYADLAAQVVHFTGYEVPVERIQVPPEFRAVGNLVASADILAQMSDRCYLEKCFDRLYTEFVLAGIARSQDDMGNEKVLFSSPQDLVIKTPGFYIGAKRRLEETLQGAHHHVEKHFNGQNLYLEEVEKNIQFAEYMIEHGADIGMLQRTPPKTPGSDQPSAETEVREQHVEDRRKSTGDRRKNPAMRYPDLLERRKNKQDRRRNPPHMQDKEQEDE